MAITIHRHEMVRYNWLEERKLKESELACHLCQVTLELIDAILMDVSNELIDHGLVHINMSRSQL